MTDREKQEMRKAGEVMLKQRNSLIASHQSDIAQWTRRLENTPERDTLGRDQAQRIIRGAQTEIDELEQEIANIRAKLAEMEA